MTNRNLRNIRTTALVVMVISFLLSIWLHDRVNFSLPKIDFQIFAPIEYPDFEGADL